MFRPVEIFLAHDRLATGLGRRSSGRQCLLCHRAVSLDDGFGRNEGVCAMCASRASVGRHSRLRALIQGFSTRFAARPSELAPPPQEEPVYDMSSDEIRAA